jgi:hypothetical protein
MPAEDSGAGSMNKVERVFDTTLKLWMTRRPSTGPDMARAATETGFLRAFVARPTPAPFHTLYGRF